MSGLPPQRRLEDVPGYQQTKIEQEKSITRLREIVTIVLLGLFVLTVLFELGLVASAYIGRTKPDTWLLLAPTLISVPQVAALMTLVVKWLFPSRD